jgi:arsenate reductase-like glutaredoxin family protein
VQVPSLLRKRKKLVARAITSDEKQLEISVNPNEVQSLFPC